MKNIVLAFGLLFVINAHSSIEHTLADLDKPTEAQMTHNRACFQTLVTEGCGDPGEDPTHFRACLKSAYQNLTSNCKALMTKLYGQK